MSAAGVIEVAATVAPNLHRMGLTAGETLLVLGGSGGIGSFAIQYGARVLTTASAGKLDHCRAYGADVAIDYRTDWAQGVREATDGRGVDVILDVMGAKYLGANVDLLARGGRLVVIGLQGGAKGELDLNALLRRGRRGVADVWRRTPAAGSGDPVPARAGGRCPHPDRVGRQRGQGAAGRGRLTGWAMVPADSRLRLTRTSRRPSAPAARSGCVPPP